MHFSNWTILTVLLMTFLLQSIQINMPITFLPVCTLHDSWGYLLIYHRTQLCKLISFLNLYPMYLRLMKSQTFVLKFGTNFFMDGKRLFMFMALYVCKIPMSPWTLISNSYLFPFSFLSFFLSLFHSLFSWWSSYLH